MKEFSYRTRQENLKKLQEEPYDFAIIGGGITGAGVARDAASRGLKVALIEARDFAFGTSSRSSKLIHGGIRYLENLEFKLVFEALSERRLLFELAPHLVHPLRFVLPMYKGDRVSPWLMGVGMWLYDALALFEMPELHQHLSPAASTDRVPYLREEGLLGSFVYSDAYMDDDRLVLETLRSANDLGATLVNYVSATGAETSQDPSKPKGTLTGLICRDEKSNREFTIRARHFISTVGPWTDIVGSTLFEDWKNILRPSKGIHVTLERERLPVEDAIVMSTRSDKRIVFVIPRNEMVIVGTTDTDYREDPAEVHSNPEDVKYILEILAEYFPSARITIDDLVSSYAGVRPLVADNAATESATSREHLIARDPRGVTFVAGGKYTTYRKMAEQTVNEALKAFSIEDQTRFKHNQTKVALNPLATEENLKRAQLQVDLWSRLFHWPREDVEKLVTRHAYEAEILLKFAEKSKLKKNLWELEANHAIQNTMCLNLVDFYLRRTPLFLSAKDQGKQFLNAISQAFQSHFNWSENELRAQVSALDDHIQKELNWKL